MKVNIEKYNDDGSDRVADVHIDDFDVWSLDHTLAIIIAPALKILRTKKHGAPAVELTDVPDNLNPPDVWDKGIHGEETDPNFFKRWDYVIDEMIFTFSEIAEDKPNEPEFNNKNMAAFNAYHERIDNGTKLFGKYYQALWD